MCLLNLFHTFFFLISVRCVVMSVMLCLVCASGMCKLLSDPHSIPIPLNEMSSLSLNSLTQPVTHKRA